MCQSAKYHHSVNRPATARPCPAATGSRNREPGPRHFSPVGPFVLSVLAWLCVWHLLVAPERSGAAEPKDVSFSARCDGTIQRYVLILPEGFVPTETHHLLVALHGHGSDRWQFAKQTRDECRAARDVAANGKMIFVSPDYRAKTSWMGPKAEADMVQIIEDLKRQFRIGKVVLCGGSMGGTSCLTFSALHPELVDGVASMNGAANLLEYQNFQDAIRESFGGLKTEIPNEYKKRSRRILAGTVDDAGRHHGGRQRRPRAAAERGATGQ